MEEAKMKISHENIFHTQNKIPMRYVIAKIAVVIFFIVVMVGTGFTAWLLLAKGITMTRLLLAAVLMVSYLGGAAHGEIDQRIEKMQKVTDGN